MNLPTEEAVREALRSVDDPEVGMNVVDLGLVYRIDITPERIHVAMTMTTPACPMGDLITSDAQSAIGALAPDGVEVDVELVWDPPWSPDMMSQSAREAFGWQR
jgi:metal-sulfur cluster biosynthetic enzyme